MINITTHRNRFQRTAFNIVVFLASALITASIIKYFFGG